MKNLFFAFLFSFVPVGAHALVGTVVSGVVVGGAGSVLLKQAGDEVDDAIRQAETAAHGLLGRADEIAKKRLDQIDVITQRTIENLVGKSEAAALEILKQTTKKVDALRQDIVSDLRTTIWAVECSGKRLLNEDIPTALGGLGRLINANSFEITPPVAVLDRPGIVSQLLGKSDPYIIQIRAPFDQTYIQVRDLMELSIAPEQIGDDFPAHAIVSTWEYLAAFALRTSCFYNGSSDRWNQEFANYKEQARKWRDLVFIVIASQK